MSERMMARLAVLLACMCAVLTAWAQDVTCSQAQGVAAEFFKSHGVESGNMVQQKTRLRAPNRVKANSPYYIFNSSDASAFVVVSGDSRTQQVLAYSTEGAFDEDNVAPGAAYMLEQYELYVNSLQDGANAPAAKANVNFGSGKLIETALWNQSYNFWWSQCPIVNGQNTHAGCVATAMAILMRHYEWPAKGYGSKSYTTKTHGLNLSANFEEFNYNWASLPKGNQTASGWNSTNQDLIAKILKQCGVAASMDYKPSGSSASLNNQAVALFRYFGYTLSNYIIKNKVGENEWYYIIKQEIDGNNPILYEGVDDDGGGHAFVCDGYDSSGNLHFNFGWSGTNNGYYAILSSNMEYHNDQRMNIGVRPDENSSTKYLPDFHLKFAGTENPQGLTIMGEGIIHRGQSFTARVYNLFNTTDNDVSFRLALFVCDGNGNRKLKLGEYTDLALNRGSSYGWVSVGCSIPYDYSVSDTDYLMMFSSTDDGETWKKVTCYDPGLESIHIIDIYDATTAHMEMVSMEGKGFGLSVKDGSIVNVKGLGFYLIANCLQNILSQSFAGEVAAFLCDNGGNKKLQIGSYSVDELGAGYYYNTFQISCNIPRGSDVEVGDKIMYFSRMSGEETWASVICSDPDKAYIEITEETMTATPPQLKMVEGNGDYTIGLTLYSNNQINIKGTSFYIGGYSLKNIMSGAFSGDIAFFLCDKSGKPVYQLGTKSISSLGSGSRYTSPQYISCKITSDMEVISGDRICLFSRFQDDDTWKYVDCDVQEKAYLEIPEDLLPTQKTINFSNPYATFCSRYNLNFSGVTNVYAYKAVQKDYESISLERVTEVKGGEGVLLRGIVETNGSYSCTPTVAASAEAIEGNLFVGVLDESTYVTQDAPDCTKYVLGALRGIPGFYIANGVTLKSGQAYLAIPGASYSSPSRFTMHFPEDDVTGIIRIEEECETEGVYSLQGVKVNNPEKGIYIINGKKKYIRK